MLCNVHNRYLFSISDKTKMAEESRPYTIVCKQFPIRVVYSNLNARQRQQEMKGEKEEEKTTIVSLCQHRSQLS